MKAVSLVNQKLTWTEVPRPEMGAGEVRIKVHATAVNRADLAQRAGRYPPPPGVTDILGLECSGEVLEVDSGVEWPQPGDQVCALLAGGGYAEEVVCPAAHVLPLPPRLDLTQAAGVPEVYTTAWLNLRREGELAPGERVLVHAGASGVGTACIQLCCAWGNPIFVTVGSSRKEEFCRSLGAAGTANRKEGPWALKVREWGGADLILDPVGGSYLESNIHTLNAGGRLVNIGLLGGIEGTLPMGRVLVKRLKLIGSVLRSRSRAEKGDILRGVREGLWPLFESQHLSPVIDKVLPITSAEEAHQLVGSNQTVGKVLLRI